MKELTKRRLIVGGFVALLVSGSPVFHFHGHDAPRHVMVMDDEGRELAEIDRDDATVIRPTVHAIVRAAVAAAAGRGDMDHLFD